MPDARFRLPILVVVLTSSLIGCFDTSSEAGGDGAHAEAACAACEISLVEEVELGSDGDPASVSADAMVFPCGATTLDGDRFASARLTGAGEVALYDATGAHVGVVGRGGEGPGELGRDLRALPRPGGGLIVVDNGNYRMAVFDSTGAWVRGFRIPGRAVSHAVLEDRSVLLHLRPSGGHEERLFHLFDSTGALVHAFGVPDPKAGELDQWIVSAAPDGGFYTASLWKYDIRRWSAPDSLRWRFSRSPAWFPEVDISPADFEGLYVESAPPPTLAHVLDRGDGLVWTFSIVSDPAWEPARPEAVTPEWARSTFDTMIEVIDAASSRVVATRRYDDVVGPMCDRERLFTVRRAPSGDTRVVVLRPELTGWPR